MRRCIGMTVALLIMMVGLGQASCGNCGTKDVSQADKQGAVVANDAPKAQAADPVPALKEQARAKCPMFDHGKNKAARVSRSDKKGTRCRGMQEKVCPMGKKNKGYIFSAAGNKS